MQPNQQPLDPPNYTMFPNRLLDKELGELDPPEWCVLCYIVRHTFGWHKSMDLISYNQFLKGTYTRDGRQIDKGCGLANSTALRRALTRLEERGLIACERRKGEDGRLLSSAYSLVMAADEEQLAQAAGAETPTTSGVVAPTTPGVVAPYYAGRSTLLRPALYPTTPGVEQQNKTTTKETTTKETGEVPPVVMSTKGDDSARRARAREGQEQQAIDPEEPWLATMAEVIHRRTGVYASREDLKAWKAVLWEQLDGTTEQERDDFMAYVFDDPNRYLEERRNANEVCETLQQDGAKWNALGRPRTKKRARAQVRGVRVIPSAAEVMEQDLGPCCDECKKIAGARHGPDCRFAGQVVGQERKTS